MSTTLPPIKVIMADDHLFFREGFKLMFKKQSVKELELLAEASNGLELIEKVKVSQPDIIVTDIYMPIMNGLEAIPILKKEFPSIPIIALSMNNEPGMVQEVIEIGASGYLLKNTDWNEIVAAVKTVRSGEPYLCSTLSARMAKEYFPFQKTDFQITKKELTYQEIRIIRLICQQKSTKEIAKQLNLSIRTIEDYRHHIQVKTKSRNMIGIVLYALKHKIIKLEDL